LLFLIFHYPFINKCATFFAEDSFRNTPISLGGLF
jgi:hypothetical protein